MYIVIRALISEDSGQANLVHTSNPLYDMLTFIIQGAGMENMQGDIPVCVQSGSVYWICTSLYASIVFDLKCHGPPIRCKLQVMWPLIELDNLFWKMPLCKNKHSSFGMAGMQVLACNIKGVSWNMPLKTQIT